MGDSSDPESRSTPDRAADAEANPDEESTGPASDEADAQSESHEREDSASEDSASEESTAAAEDGADEEVPWDGLDDDHTDPWEVGEDPAETGTPPESFGDEYDSDPDNDYGVNGFDEVAADETARTDGAVSGDAEAFDPADSEYVEDATVTVEEDDDDGLFGTGPDYDQEMPLADHIEEMVRRLTVVIAIGGIATMLAFPTSEHLLNYLWRSYIPNPVGPPGTANRPHLYGPLELLLTQLKVASLAGVVVGLPVFVYESYRFMRPGLYPRERRYYLASVPTSLILAVAGVLFAHFLLLPAIFAYFSYYTVETAKIAFALKETFNLIITMMMYMAVVFQIPLFMMLAIMMNLVTRRWMEDKRILFWGAFATIAFTFVAVDPTGMAPIIIAVTMIVLFEGTLLLLRWTGN